MISTTTTTMKPSVTAATHRAPDQERLAGGTGATLPRGWACGGDPRAGSYRERDSPLPRRNVQPPTVGGSPTGAGQSSWSDPYGLTRTRTIASAHGLDVGARSQRRQPDSPVGTRGALLTAGNRSAAGVQPSQRAWARRARSRRRRRCRPRCCLWPGSGSMGEPTDSATRPFSRCSSMTRRHMTTPRLSEAQLAGGLPR